MGVKIRKVSGDAVDASADGATEAISDSLTRKERAVVKDALGREITLVRPRPLAQFRLVKVLGAAANNTTYLQMVTPMIWVAKIDDVDVHFPTSEREIELTIDLLGEEGLEAVMLGIQKEFFAETMEAGREAVRK